MRKQITETMKEAKNKKSAETGTEGKLRDSTKKLLGNRTSLKEKHWKNATNLKEFNQKISKSIRKDVRLHNTIEITGVIGKVRD